MKLSSVGIWCEEVETYVLVLSRWYTIRFCKTRYMAAKGTVQDAVAGARSGIGTPRPTLVVILPVMM